MASAATARHTWNDQFRLSFQEIEVNSLEEGATALMYACQQENVEQLISILKKKVSWSQFKLSKFSRKMMK